MARTVALVVSLAAASLLCVGALLLLSPPQPCEKSMHTPLFVNYTIQEGHANAGLPPLAEDGAQQGTKQRPRIANPYNANPGRPLLVFMAGVEGSGHHLGTILLKELFPARPEEQQLGYAVRDLGRAFNDMFIGTSSEMYMDNLQKARAAMKKAAQLARAVDAPVIPYWRNDAWWYLEFKTRQKKRVDNLFSWPFGWPTDNERSPLESHSEKSVHLPDLHVIHEMAEAAGVELRVLITARELMRCVRSIQWRGGLTRAVKTTDHRARIVEQTKSTYLGALALEAQLARLPQHIPFGAIRNDLVRKYPEEHARNLAAFLGATTSKVSTILLKQLTAHNATALASERSFRTLLEPTDVKAMAMILYGRTPEALDLTPPPASWQDATDAQLAAARDHDVGKLTAAAMTRYPALFEQRFCFHSPLFGQGAAHVLPSYAAQALRVREAQEAAEARVGDTRRDT